jgi:hypothetical protein
MVKRIITGTLKYQSPKHGGYRHYGASVEIDDRGKRRDVTYYTGTSEFGWGTEVYSGPNYVRPFDAKGKSYSRSYKAWKNLPKKYLDVAMFLRRKTFRK